MSKLGADPLESVTRVQGGGAGSCVVDVDVEGLADLCEGAMKYGEGGWLVAGVE